MNISPMIRIALLPAAVASLACNTTAQTGLPGSATSFALGISANDDTGNELLRRPAGDQTVPPAPFGAPPNTMTPDYRVSQLFPNAPANINISMDAFSTGNDFLPMNGNMVDPAQQFWAALLYTIRGDVGAQGEAGGTVAANAGSPNSGSFVYGYYFPGSSGIAPQLPGFVSMEQRPTDMALNPTDELNAIDLGIPVLSQTDGIGDGVFIKEGSLFLFSLSKESATSAGVATWLGDEISPNPGINVLESGATVYALTWKNGAWDSLRVFRTPDDLDLDNDENVDAIAYDSINHVFLFSTEIEHDLKVRSQVLVQLPNSTISPLETSTGSQVAGELEIETNDDIDAFCTFDPDAGFFSAWLGTPYTAAPQVDVSVSTTRELDAAGDDWIIVNVSIPEAYAAGTNQAIFHFYDENLAPLPGLSKDFAANASRVELRFTAPAAPAPLVPTTPPGTLTGAYGIRAEVQHLAPGGGTVSLDSWISVIRIL